jgi:hypothetical protein
MSEEFTQGELSLRAPELVSENIHRVKRADADDSRNAREQFKDTLEEQKDKETAERDERDRKRSEEAVVAVHQWETIHDDIILSESARQLMDRSEPVEPTELNRDQATENLPAEPVPRIHLTA